SCLVLFIQTNGQEGKIAPLAQYPLSADISATLVISDAVVFAGVVPLVPCAGLSAAGHQEEDARWSTVLSGTIDAGLAGDTEEPERHGILDRPVWQLCADSCSCERAQGS